MLKLRQLNPSVKCNSSNNTVTRVPRMSHDNHMHRLHCRPTGMVIGTTGPAEDAPPLRVSGSIACAGEAQGSAVAKSAREGLGGVVEEHRRLIGRYGGSESAPAELLKDGC